MERGTKSLGDPDPGIDVERLRELLEVVGPENLHVVAEVVELFERRSPGQVAALKAALGGADPEVIVSRAHALKSSASNLGVRLLSRRTQEIEFRARHGELDGLEELGEDLERLQAEGARALRTWLEGAVSEGPPGGAQPCVEA